MRGVEIPQNLVDYIVETARSIHHGTIRIELNADNPHKVDVITETRERFSTSNDRKDA